VAKKDGRRYTAKFKFQVVLEALRRQKADAEIARAYQGHPITLSKWKKEFLEKGAEVFGGRDEVRASEQKISKLEQMLGQKEVELALLKNFMARAKPGREDPDRREEPRWLRSEPLPESAERREIELALSEPWLRWAPGERGGN
jgi:transposase-like protein